MLRRLKRKKAMKKKIGIELALSRMEGEGPVHSKEEMERTNKELKSVGFT
jgi:hypothetical protein